MLTNLDGLPQELYSAIFEHVPEELLKPTILALTRAIPRAPVPLQHLFLRIVIRQSRQIPQLYIRLRHDRSIRGSVRELTFDALEADPEVVINIVALLHHLTSFSLLVGPGFGPEQLFELFTRPKKSIEYISLRFRPYVKKATYDQFLKGSYYDTTLTALSNWPAGSLRRLSIIQDPLNEEKSRPRFAQPLVFFSLEGFRSISRSAFAVNVSSLRIQVPSRDITPYICALPHSFLSLKLLDMSTCLVKGTDIEVTLMRLADLQHLVLDGCNLIRAVDPEEGEWLALGKACATVGAKRAKEREKQLKNWFEEHLAQLTSGSNTPGQRGAVEQGPSVTPQEGRKARPGRKGLANATISIRKPPPQAVVAQARTTLSPRTGMPKIRVLPPPPNLRSLSTSNHATANVEKHTAIRKEFSKGWEQGLDQLVMTGMRLKTSSTNGVRIMFMAPRGSDASSQAQSSASGSSSSSQVLDSDLLQSGLKGLVDLDSRHGTSIQWADLNYQPPCPVLCFGGADNDADHPIGCGHSVSRDPWEHK